MRPSARIGSPGPVALLSGLAVALALGAAAETRYPKERFESPITAAVAAHLRDVAAVGLGQGMSAGRFVKVGDSITVNSQFMSQFTCPDHDPAVHHDWDWTRDLGPYGYLRGAMDHFLVETVPGGTTSYDRVSLAAQVGAGADWAMAGEPSPLEQELDEVGPLLAVVMFGTNDVGGYGDDRAVLDALAEGLLAIVDRCLGRGVVPVLTAPPLRVGYEGRTLTLSHLARALAQARQVPFVDLHRAMVPLPDHGLLDDGVHPNSMQYNRASHLTPEGLEFGHNTRNWLTLQALDRLYRVVVLRYPALDLEPLPALAGDGSPAAPFAVDGVPFVDARATSGEHLALRYSFQLDQARDLRLLVADQGSTEVDLALLDSASSVLATDDGLLDVALGPGSYHVEVATRDGLPANAGAFQLVILDRADDGAPSSDGIFLDGGRAVPFEVAGGVATPCTIEVTALDDGAIVAVEADLSELGGPAQAAMAPDPDGQHRCAFEVAAATPAGDRLATVTATDDQGHRQSVPVWVRVLGPTLFADGFELGGTGAWSQTAP